MNSQILLAETAVDVLSIVSQFGSAGLAVLAVWWLTNKYEKLQSDITSKHLEGMQILSESVKKLEQKMDDAHRNVSNHDARGIELLQDLQHKLDTLAKTSSETERRLEWIERSIEIDKTKRKPQPPAG